MPSNAPGPSIAPSPSAAPVAARSPVRMVAVPVAVSHPKNAEPIFTPPKCSRWRSMTSSAVSRRASTTSSQASGRISRVVCGPVLGAGSRFRNGSAGSAFGSAGYSG
jgi:hypothetical protein